MRVSIGVSCNQSARAKVFADLLCEYRIFSRTYTSIFTSIMPFAKLYLCENPQPIALSS